MQVHFANEIEIKNWNKKILANPDNGNVLQGLEFAKQKESDRWTPRFIATDDLAVTVLERPVFGLGKLWYIPKGPGITTARQLDKLLLSLRKFAKQHGVFVVKIEPELKKQDETLADLIKLGLIKARPIQPNSSTVLLDLSPSVDTIMATLNQKGRYAIRRAERDGVSVKQVDSTEENCKTMYGLLALTAAGSFSIRSYNYYKSFWQRYSTANLGQMFFAYVDNQVVAAAYAITFGKKSTYKDGASVRERIVYGASHLLQWHVITWAKEKGSLLHDLCGAPPSDRINDPSHPHHGIGRFKTSFNKEVTDYIGVYDFAINPTAYKVWQKVGERIALRINHLLHHESYY